MTEIRVLHGNPTPEELAVVVSVVVAAGNSRPAAQEQPRFSNWGRPVMRTESGPGRDAWWRSGLPRP